MTCTEAPAGFRFWGERFKGVGFVGGQGAAPPDLGVAWIFSGGGTLFEKKIQKIFKEIFNKNLKIFPKCFENFKIFLKKIVKNAIF